MTKNKTTLQNNHKPQKTDTFDCVKQKTLHQRHHKKNKKTGREWNISAEDNK